MTTVGPDRALGLIDRAVDLQGQVRAALRDGHFLGERAQNPRIETAAHEAERAVGDAVAALLELQGRLLEVRR